jgi:MOSC domain-containing protein YiiM
MHITVMHQTLHPSLAELQDQLDHIRQAPADNGVLEMIVCRPDVDQRRMLFEAELDIERGLIGDTWLSRGNYKGGPANPDCQINIMNSRVVALVAQDRERWPLAGDQLYIDLDLSDDNLPGSRIAIGTAILEVTSEPHTGCRKFASRYGDDAKNFVNSAAGKKLHLRGINARIIQSGLVRTGDTVKKL